MNPIRLFLIVHKQPLHTVHGMTVTFGCLQLKLNCVDRFFPVFYQQLKVLPAEEIVRHEKVMFAPSTLLFETRSCMPCIFVAHVRLTWDPFKLFPNGCLLPFLRLCL